MIRLWLLRMLGGVDPVIVARVLRIYYLPLARTADGRKMVLGIAYMLKRIRA